MLKFSSAVVLLVLLLAGVSYATEAGRAANATLGEAIINQAYIVSGEAPYDATARR
jgi:hypothetical protein